MTHRVTKHLIAMLIIAASLALIVSGCSSGKGQANRSAAGAPDGDTKVIFSEWVAGEDGSFTSMVSIANLGASKKRVILTEEGRIDGLKLSPDNTTLAYLNGPDKVFVVDIDGTNRREIDSSTAGWPNWSPDGRKLAYVKRDGASGKSKLVVYSLKDNTTSEFALGEYELAPCSALSWFPDGKRVAVFVGGREEVSWTIISVDTRTKQVRKVTERALLRGFTPDGSLEVVRPVVEQSAGTGEDAFAAYRPPVTWEIWQGDSHEQLKRVIKDRLPSNLVSWSPDGTRIVFAKADEEYGTQLFTASVDGTGARRLTKLSQHDQFIPVWSYDGRSIVFSAIKLDGTKPGRYLYYCDVETGRTATVLKGADRPMQLGSIFVVY